MRNVAEGFVVGAIVIENGLRGIDVGGRAHARREVGQAAPLAIEIVAGIGEQVTSMACGAAVMQRIRILPPPGLSALKMLDLSHIVLFSSCL